MFIELEAKIDSIVNKNVVKSDGGFSADYDVAARDVYFALNVGGGQAPLLAVRMRTRECPQRVVPRDEAHLLAPMKVLLLPRRSLKSDI